MKIRKYLVFFTLLVAVPHSVIGETNNSKKEMAAIEDYVDRFSDEGSKLKRSDVTVKRLNVLGSSELEILLNDPRMCGSGICGYAVYGISNNDVQEVCYMGDVELSSKTEELVSVDVDKAGKCKK